MMAMRAWALAAGLAGARAQAEPCAGGVSLIDGGDVFQPDYNNNQDCAWLLTCSDPSLAPQITFIDFHTEGDWDFVYIYDGADVSSHIAVTLHGGLGDTVEQITGSSSSVLVRLVTDGTVTGGGFTASYTCENAVPAAPPDPCAGDPVIVTDGGEFFHSTLTADQECKWQLVCSDNTLSPRITWTAFDLENANDHVYLQEGPTNTLQWLNDVGGAPGSATASFTGAEIPDVWTDMHNDPCCDSSSGVLYLSDGAIDGLGFVASWECVDNTIPYVPPPGEEPGTGTVTGTALSQETGCHTYRGCWRQPSTSVAWYTAATSFLHSGLASALSPNSCIHYCSILGYAYAGLQPEECQCGDVYTAGEQGSCDATCPGDLRQMCGGAEAVSIWQTACEGEARISQVDLVAIFRKVDDSDNEKIELSELVDLFDGQDNNALVLPDCSNEDFPDYWLGDGTCDDGSAGRANLNCKLYACDNGDCGTSC